MVTIQNYNKLTGQNFGDWKCGLAVEHPTLYRFSFHKGVYNNGRWSNTYWIELSRTSYIDSDGDEVYPIVHKNVKHKTIITKGYLKSLDKVRVFFFSLLRENAG